MGRAPRVVSWVTVAIVAAAVGLLAPVARSDTSAGVRFSPSTSLAGAKHVVWGFRLQASAAIPANGSLTISLPGASVFTNSSTYAEMLDVTTGTDELPGTVVGASQITVSPRHAIAAGDVIAVEVVDVANPPSGTAFSSITLSEGGAITGSGVFTASAQPVGELTFSPSTTAGAATGVTWGLRFRLSSTGRLPIGAEIAVTAPTGGTFGAHQFRMIDLTTATDLGGGSATLSGGGATATVSVPSDAAKFSLQPGDLIELELYGATNPAAGVPYSSLGVSTDADTTVAHPGSGAFTSARAVSGVKFTASTVTSGASANWGVSFTTSSTGRLVNGGQIVVGAPSGTGFPTAASDYQVLDPATGAKFSVAGVTTTATTVTLAVEGFPNPDVIRAGDAVTLDVQGVTNPTGGVSAGAVSIATSSDPSPVRAAAPASSPSGSVAGVKVSQTTLAAGATGVVWGAEFATSAAGGLAANSGTITLTAPAGTFAASPFVILQDLTTGSLCAGTCLAVSGGARSSVKVTPSFAIGPGNLVALQVIGSVNPAAGTVAANAIGVSTSSDTTTAHQTAGVVFSAAQPAMGVSVQPSTTAGTATHTAWTALFTASPTGGIANDRLEPTQIQLGLPAGSAVESSPDFAVYDLTTGTFEESGGSASTGATSARFFVPAAISPGDLLALELIGVANPATGSYPGSAVTVSTSSDTVPASPSTALSFSAPNLPTTDMLLGTDPAGSASDDRLLAELTASPTGELSSDVGRIGSVTLTAPAGTQFSSGGCVLALDLTTGDYFPCYAGTTSGSSDTFTPGFPVGPGDVVEFSIASVTNPASGLVPPTHFHVNTSSDDGAPSVTGDTFSGTEGAAATGPAVTIDGSCPATGTIGWGDGSQSAATIACQGLIATLGGTHTYAEFGSYTTTASAEDGSHGTGSATIADAALSASPKTGLTATAGASFSGTVATFSDANPSGRVSDYSASIDWGDGTTSSGTITASGSQLAVAGTHTYAAPRNPATVVITIDDAGGSSTSTVESVTVNAPGAPAVTLIQPANGATVTSAQPTFSGGAGTAPADAPQITVEIYAGGAVSSVPVQTLTTTAGGGAWSVTASAALANGTYTAQAQQATTTGVIGYSPANVFRVNAPVPPPPPSTGPGSGGGPPPGCATTASFGLIAAVGCLQAVVDPSQIPAAEKHALCATLKLDPNPCNAALKSDIQSGQDDPLIAQSIVRVNGLDITPDNGGVVLLDPKDKLVITSHSRFEILGDLVTLFDGPLQLDGASGGEVKPLEVSLDQLIAGSKLAAKALNLAGFRLGGTLGVRLVQDGTTLSAAVRLPTVFTAIGIGGAISASVSATANNQDDIQFNELYFRGPNVNLGGFQLTNLAFCYQNHVADGFCQQKTGVDYGTSDLTASSWNATAKAVFGNVTINAAPPPPMSGLGFVGGNFDFAGVQASFAAPGVQIASGVFLNEIGGSLQLQPVRVSGTVGITAGDVVRINGAVFVVVPASGEQYTFTGNELGKLIKPPLALPKITVDQFAVAAGGSVAFKLPVLGYVPLADGYVMYAYPSYIAAGGGFNVTLGKGVLVFDGGIQGAVNVQTGQFDIEGNLGLQFTPFNWNLQAGAVVSNVGVAACFSSGSSSYGVGYTWATQAINPMLGTCNLTAYQVAVAPSAARDAAAGLRVRVPGRVPDEMIKLIGRGGAPDVSIAGPGGTFVIKRAVQLNATYIGIIRPRAGNYTITPNPGSPGIAEVLDARGFTPTLHARVSGRGTHRRLVFALNRQPGERVTFRERGPGVDHVIGTARASRGTLSFTSAPGPAGIRQIVATAAENGTPVILASGARNAGEIAVASYRAAGPQRLGRVHRLHARRAGRRLLIGFDRARGARRYAAVVALRDGLRTDYVVTHGALAVSVPTVGPLGGTVTVVALGDGLRTRTGPASTVAIEVPGRHKPPHRHKPPQRHH